MAVSVYLFILQPLNTGSLLGMIFSTLLNDFLDSKHPLGILFISEPIWYPELQIKVFFFKIFFNKVAEF